MMLKIAILSAVAFTSCMAVRSSIVSPSGCQGIMDNYVIMAFRRMDPYVLNKPFPCVDVGIPAPKVEICVNESRIINLKSAERTEDCSAPDARDPNAIMFTALKFDILYAKTNVTIRVEGLKPIHFTIKALVDDVRCNASLIVLNGYRAYFIVQSVGKIVYKIEGLPGPVATLASSLADEEIKKSIRFFLDMLFHTELTNAVNDDLKSLVIEFRRY